MYERNWLFLTILFLFKIGPFCSTLHHTEEIPFRFIGAHKHLVQRKENFVDTDWLHRKYGSFGWLWFKQCFAIFVHFCLPISLLVLST